LDFARNSFELCPINTAKDIRHRAVALCLIL